MTYTKKNGRYVFEKDGVYYALTPEQVQEMADLTAEILKNRRKRLTFWEKCHKMYLTIRN